MADAEEALSGSETDEPTEGEVTGHRRRILHPQKATQIPMSSPSVGSYVEKIRREAQGLRDRAKATESRADELARRLHTELARSSGKLADPTDLAFDADHLDDGDKLGAAIDSLLESKPHLRSRVPSGNVGQDAKDTGQPVSLLSHLKSLV
jgi:hypothetical protein